VRLQRLAVDVLIGSICSAALVAGLAGPAAAQVGERIRSYDVTIQIQDDGHLVIVETIDYDFGSAEHHGIFRDVPVRYRYDDRYDRVYRMDVLAVQARPAGTPAQYSVDQVGPNEEIKIGDPDRTITGQHEYTITYTIEGAFNGFPDHDELYWNAIGADWSVPIDLAAVSVTGPTAFTGAVCFAGPQGSNLPCTRMERQGRTVRIAQSALGPFQGLTFAVALPKSAVPEPRPILKERWSLARAFSATPATLGLFGLLLVAGVAWFVRLAWRVGRDRRAVGGPVDVAFASADGDEQAVPLFERGDYGVEYTPPDGLRPGQVGTLVDEQANALDVTASVVDLAVRGYLRIEEIPKHGLFGKADYRLVQLKEGDDLLPYERKLLDGLFEDATTDDGGDPSVKLSALKTKFVTRLRRVQDALYDDAVGRGWFDRRPDKTRTSWAGRGVLLTVAGGLMLFVLIRWTHFALVGIPVLLVGLAMIVAAHWMPRRTPVGTGLVRRVRGFRHYIDVAEEEPSQFAERANLFYEFLPYAVVFGLTDKWASAFRGLSEMPAQSWYVGTTPFTVDTFSHSISGFTVASAGTIASTPGGSGSSGFGGGGSSGGGGGGGGGGSW
jgi:predicted membrane protein DUF2207